MAQSILTPQAQDFPRWYQDVVAKAEMAENGPVRGTMIIKPWGYGLWERVQAELDARIKATGHDNVYFPMFIPHEFLQREATHVEGFSPELAIVTHAGGEELAEPLVVRPTSETMIGDAMSRWVQGYRDLPLKLNQWANVVRWELRPRLFLRTTEFLWQEGHTAHSTWQEALDEALTVFTEVYGRVLREVMALPSVPGLKTARETFAGAELTYTHEGMMRDGKALQMGTSHHLGQNFARAFDITFSDADGQVQHAYTTSWGVSTRVIGALVMAHGDDRGLRIPPRLAPLQAVVLAIKDEVAEVAGKLVDALTAAGVRARLDDRTNLSFGRRATDWELKGVPVRLEVGPRDVAAGVATLVRRDSGAKEPVSLDSAAAVIPGLLEEIQAGLLEEAERALTSAPEVTAAADVDGPGFFRMPYSALGEQGEDALAQRGYSVRCLTTADGGIPTSRDEADLVAWIAKAY